MIESNCCALWQAAETAAPQVFSIRHGDEEADAAAAGDALLLLFSGVDVGDAVTGVAVPPGVMLGSGDGPVLTGVLSPASGSDFWHAPSASKKIAATMPMSFVV